MKVWHDDVRPAPEGWKRAHDNPQALFLLRNGDVSVMSLDHDLGASPDADVWARGCSPDGDGRDLVRAMIAEGLHLKPARIYIHSWNSAGAREMAALLRDAGCEDVVVRPYSGAEG